MNNKAPLSFSTILSVKKPDYKGISNQLLIIYLMS